MILVISVIIIMSIIISIWVAQLKYELREDTITDTSLADSFKSVWKNIKEKKPNFSK